MVMTPPTMVVAAVRTFADVPAADGNAIVEPAAALAADGNAVVEPTAALAADRNAVVESTAALEATTAALQATAAALQATTAALQPTTAAIETTAAAIEATAAVKATATAATATASGICRAGQNHRATQHGSTCGEFRHKVHGCCNSTPCHACSITFVREKDWSARIREKARSSVGIGRRANC
jgi:hypothetical protein